MTKDVFKYLKSSRSLLEGKAAEEAKKKGYVGDKSGYWIDRKGERVARTIGGELKMLTPREKAEAQGETSSAPKGEEESKVSCHTDGNRKVTRNVASLY